jgi:PASTA domain-containing protein
MLVRPELLALIVIAVALAVFSARARPASADFELTSGGGSLSLSNTHEGSAILSLAPMRPGDSVTGSVTIGNTGTLPGDLTLSTSNLLDIPGPSAGVLSAALLLTIEDVTNPGTPVGVYTGSIPGLAPVSLGSLAAGASRDYSFRVLFPSLGALDNVFQGSAMSVQFDWTATNPGDDTEPPETTIGSGLAGLSSSREARISFTADESGSTFECSLDGTPFASCSSPATYAGLPDGGHVFSVRGTDASGNTDPTPGSYSWTVDATAPSVPGTFRGAKTKGRLVLSWSASSDQSGIAGYVLYANGAKLRELGSAAASADVGLFKLSDDRRFQVAALDAARNIGAKTYELVIVPKLSGATLAKAKAKLVARGLKPGKISRVRSSRIPAGRVVKSGRSGVLSTGSKVALTVSLGRGGTSSSGSTGGGGSGGRGSTGGTGGASPATPTGGNTPAAPTVPLPTLPPTLPTSAPDSPQAAGPDKAERPTLAIEPTSSSGGSGLRRAFGLALLSSALLAGAGAWWRLQRRPAWKATAPAPGEILFWDQRLARVALTSIRRITGRV